MLHRQTVLLVLQTTRPASIDIDHMVREEWVARPERLTDGYATLSLLCFALCRPELTPPSTKTENCSEQQQQPNAHVASTTTGRRRYTHWGRRCSDRNLARKKFIAARFSVPRIDVFHQS